MHQKFANLAHGCGTRQYYDGQCKNVDDACNTFNPLGG